MCKRRRERRERKTELFYQRAALCPPHTPRPSPLSEPRGLFAATPEPLAQLLSSENPILSLRVFTPAETNRICVEPGLARLGVESGLEELVGVLYVAVG